MKIILVLVLFFSTQIVLRKWITFALNKGLLDVPDGRKKHNKATPTSGGVVFFLPLLGAIPILLQQSNWILITITAAFMGTVGFIDDRKDLSAKVKFVAQFACATIVVAQFGHFAFLNEWSFLNKEIKLILSAIAIVAIVNAYNLMDGSDGLLGSISLLAFITIGVLSYSLNQQPITLLCLFMVPALVAFLRFNWHPAKIFMGDTGSLLLGFLIASMTLALSNSANATPQTSVLLLPAVVLPIVDMLRVMFWRLILRKHPFKSDRTHLHHVFKQLGVQPTQILLLVLLLFTIHMSTSLWLAAEGNTFNTTVLILSSSTLLAIEAVLWIKLQKVKRKQQNEQQTLTSLGTTNCLLHKLKRHE